MDDMHPSERNQAQFYSLDELQKNLFHICPKISNALENPAVENPFKLELKHQVKYTPAGLLLSIMAIVRIATVLFLFFLTYLVGRVILLGHRDKSPVVPMTGYRRIGQQIVWRLLRLLTMAAGFHKVKIKGEYAGREKAPIIIVAPHSTFIDNFLVSVLENASCVSRIENASMPIIGVIDRCLHPVYIDRSNPSSRAEGIKEIKRKALDNKYRPIFMFPEGTTTNRRALISFKHGAFCAGVPVQPVVFRHLGDEDFTSWTWDGPKFFRIMFAMCSRWENHMEVEYLPIYVPSAEEKDDPVLYASNVRKVMARQMSLPTTDHSFEDCRLMMEALNHGLPFEAGLVEYYKLSPLLGVKIHDILDELKRFANINRSKNGVISFGEFTEFLNLPRNEITRKLFNIYDLNKEDGIRFREYLIGRYIITKTFSSEEYIQKYFQEMTCGKNGRDPVITLHSFMSMVDINGNCDQEFMTLLFENMDREDDGFVTREILENFIKTYPEYCLLFMHYISMNR